MEEARYRRQDINSKWVAIVFTATSILVSVLIFNQGQKRLAEKEEKNKIYNINLEHQKQIELDSIITLRRLWEKKVNTYKDMCTQIGKIIAFGKAGKGYEEARLNFLYYYYGESILVEDKSITKPLYQYRYQLQKYHNDIGDFIGSTEENRLLKLKEASFNLINIFKENIERYSIYKYKARLSKSKGNEDVN